MSRNAKSPSPILPPHGDLSEEDAEPSHFHGYVAPRRLQDYYYILQAFEMYGERFFPDWDIREYCQREYPVHSEERAQHAELERQFELLRGGLQDLAEERFKLSISQDQKDSLDSERERLLTWQGALAAEIQRLYVFTQEHVFQEEARWARKSGALNAILGALRSGNLIALLWGDRLLHRYDWAPNSPYMLVLPMSYLAQRKDFFRGDAKPFPRRRHSVLLDSAVFDRWLRRQTAQNQEAFDRLSHDERLQIRVEQLLLDTAPRPTKESFRAHLKAEFDSSKGEADRLWAVHAPPEARLAGRKSTRNSG